MCSAKNSTLWKIWGEIEQILPLTLGCRKVVVLFLENKNTCNDGFISAGNSVGRGELQESLVKGGLVLVSPLCISPHFCRGHDRHVPPTWTHWVPIARLEQKSVFSIFHNARPMGLHLQSLPSTSSLCKPSTLKSVHGI